MTGGDLRLIERLRLDQVGHRFGLCQIDAAVEKGTHGELAGFGQPRPLRHRHLDDVLQDYRRTVAGDFDNVVGGVRLWLGKEGDDDLVDALAGSRLNQFTEMSASGLEVVSVG